MKITYLHILHTTSGSTITAILDMGEAPALTIKLNTTFEKALDLSVATDTVNESLPSLLIL